MDEERLSLEFTEEELDKVKKPVNSGERPLVFTAEELDRVKKQDKYGAGRYYHPVDTSPADDLQQGVKAGKFEQRVPTQVWQMALAGLIGALIAWVFNEIFYGDDGSDYYTSVIEIITAMAVWGALIAAIIGFFFGAVQDFLNRRHSMAIRSGLSWMLAAAAGGFIGGGLGQFTYGMLGGGIMEITMGAQIAARTMGWALLGIGVGMGQGIMTRSKKRFINGLLGGLAGGAIGGILFDFIGMSLGAGNGAVSRLVGFLALGGMIGIMIGLVEHFRKEVWFSVVSGPMQGKQFILFGTRTTFGSSGKADIVLYGDTQVPPLAFEVNQTAQWDYGIKSLAPQFPLVHNNLPKQDFKLKGGDLLQAGKHRLQFQERVKKEAS